MATLTKTDFISALARKHRRSQEHYTQALRDILQEFSAQLAAGNAIRLTGFGTFRVQPKRERSQRDIKTGEQITIPAHKTVHFKVGDVLKEAVRGKVRQK